MQKATALFVLTFGCVSCAHSSSAKPDASAQHGQATPEAPLSATEMEARGRYESGEKQAARGLHQDAIKEFEAIRTEYPYSRYAALSELRIADAHMQRSQYLEAIDAYRAFLRFHPSHADASYALGRVGEAYFAQIPKDFWLMPPAEEKDLGHVKEAITAYQELLSRYPGASGSSDVQDQLKACRKKLADHEMYVARFYFSRGSWPGAVLRLTGLLEDYPGVGYDADALYMLAQAQARAGHLDQALASVTRLLAEYPDTQSGRRGSRLLEQLEGRMP